MQKIKIFVSYSHQDETWVSKEGKHKLIPWIERQIENQAEIWTDNALKRLIGEEYTKLITEKILEADIALLLISQDFVSSQYIMDVELPIIQKQYDDKQIKILPLLVTNLTQKGKDKIRWIFDLQTYPNDTKPLIDFFNNDANWAQAKVEILEGIENKIIEISNSDDSISNDVAYEKNSSISYTISNLRSSFSVKGNFKPWYSFLTFRVIGIVVILFFLTFTLFYYKWNNPAKDPDIDGLYTAQKKVYEKIRFNNLGKFYYDNKKYDEAINAYSSAIAIEPSDELALIGLSKSYKKIGKYLEANFADLIVSSMHKTEANAPLYKSE